MRTCKSRLYGSKYNGKHFSGINLMKYIRSGFFACLFLLLWCGVASAEPEIFRDDENCMLCHRYPTIGRYETTGEKRVFYINGQDYANSVHGGIRCTNCHHGLDKIPHSDIKKVDCTTNCHLKGMSGYEVFSHKDVSEKFVASVHGRGTKEIPKDFQEDLPTCKYCHTNRDHYYVEVSGREISVPSEDESLEVFRHPKGQLRSHIDVIKLCASCHQDRKKMARHGLESIETFKDTFHWQALKFGVINAPDCISCHVPLGHSSHTVRPGSDSLSPVYVDNRVKTCSSGGGILECHPDATAGFAEGRVHKYGIKARLLTGERVFDVEDRFASLIREEAKDEIPEEEIFHYNVLKILRLIYKILIGGTIGFMSAHQALDYIRTRIRHKQSH